MDVILKDSDIKRTEVFRYLGYKGNSPDAGTIEEAENCIKEAVSKLEPKHVCKREKLEISDDCTIQMGNFKCRSKDLCKNLQGCAEVFLLAVTLGNDSDLMMRRFLKLDIYKASILQAVFTAMTEAYCDKLCEELQRDIGEGFFLRPRFSPGYGDLDLSVQRDFLSAVDARKAIGIYLSDGNIMIPEKSVTAFVGISKVKEEAQKPGCEACNKKDCSYHKG